MRKPLSAADVNAMRCKQRYGAEATFPARQRSSHTGISRCTNVRSWDAAPPEREPGVDAWLRVPYEDYEAPLSGQTVRLLWANMNLLGDKPLGAIYRIVRAFGMESDRIAVAGVTGTNGLKKMERLITIVSDMREGAFGGLRENPIIRGVLIPSAGLGSLEVIQR